VWTHIKGLPPKEVFSMTDYVIVEVKCDGCCIDSKSIKSIVTCI
jgi:hypothetical protein